MRRHCDKKYDKIIPKVKIRFNLLSKRNPYLKFSRNLKLLVTLFLMDTSLPQNALLIETIKSEVVNAGLLVAFLESAPQFILQCSIVLSTGIISKFRGPP